MTQLAWGARVSAAFRSRVDQIGAGLSPDPACPSWLMGVMYEESALKPAAHNPSGATGLIQFMPQTAAALGTTTGALLAMTAEAQLEFVADYYRPWTGRIHSVADAYGVVLWPGMVGKPDAAVIFNKADAAHPKLYLENKGLDLDADGKITRGEIARRVLAKMTLGLQPGNVWEG